MQIWQTIIDYLFPKACLLCGQGGDYLCHACNKQLIPHHEICLSCHRPTKHGVTCIDCKAERYPLDGAIIGFAYTNGCKQLIWQMKYQRKYEICTFFATKLHLLVAANQLLQKQITSQQASITYVPMHRWKQHFHRGFNQAEHLATALAKQLAMPVYKTTKKVRHTRSQTRFKRTQRAANLQGAFVHNASQKTTLQDNTVVLLVDDITTTGTTLINVAKQIRKINPTVTIRGIVIARHGR